MTIWTFTTFRARPGAKICICRSARGFFKASDPGQGWQRAETVLRAIISTILCFLPGATPTMLVAAAGQTTRLLGPSRASTGRDLRSRDLAESWGAVGTGKLVAENMKQIGWR